MPRPVHPTTHANREREASVERLGHLLVATDFSADARAAIERAAHLPLADGARVHLVHVWQPSGALDDGAEERKAIEKLSVLCDHMAQIARRAGNRAVRVLPVAAVGRSKLEIVRLADQLAVDLVVLGRHGERPIQDLVLGTTADAAIRHAKAPVLVVHGQARHGYLRPLVALELSDAVADVTELAARVADPRVRQIPAVHVHAVPFDSRMALQLPPVELAAYRGAYGEHAAEELRERLASLEERCVRWRPVVRSGDPAAAILAEARAHRADLVVVGTRGRSGMSRALLGSVAEAVIRDASCDVLVARSAGAGRTS